MEMQAEGENIYTGVPGVASYEDVKFAIMGGGAFSLALAKVLSYKNIESSLLVRDQAVADQINAERYHPKYLTDCKVPDTMQATSDPIEGKHPIFSNCSLSSVHHSQSTHSNLIPHHSF